LRAGGRAAMLPAGEGAPMLELWIPVTLGAALLQCVRTALQKHLKGQLSTNGAGFVRFFYGFPFALLYVAALVYALGYEVPGVNLRFWTFALMGGVAQIVARSAISRSARSTPRPRWCRRRSSAGCCSSSRSRPPAGSPS
jgi:hypothetical protein